MAVFGILHFMNGQMMAGMVPTSGGVIWVMGGDQSAMGQILKDLALAGGALVPAGVFASEAN